MQDTLIQIQHLLKLNGEALPGAIGFGDSNTTLVKVKFNDIYTVNGTDMHSNTTLVKVKSGTNVDEAEKFLEFKYNTC